MLALTIACTSLPAAARTAPAPTPAEPGTDTGAMWREANARLATSDYAGAITLLTRVYEQIAQDPEARMLRLRVRWTLHEAHRGAYRLDRDAQHLYVARDLLKNGMADFGPDDAELRTRSEAALVELDEHIAAIEAEQSVAMEQQRVAEEKAAAEQRRLDEANAGAQQEPPPPRPTGEKPLPRRGLLIAGGVSAGVGLVGLAILAGGFGSASQAVHTFETDPNARNDARSDIERGNAIGIAGAVVAAIGITAAAILVPLAFRRRGARPDSRAALGRRGFALPCANGSHQWMTAERCHR